MEPGYAACKRVRCIEERGVCVGECRGLRQDLLRTTALPRAARLDGFEQLHRALRPDRPLAEQAA